MTRKDGRPWQRARGETHVLPQRLPPIRAALALDATAIDRRDLVARGAEVTELRARLRFGCLDA